MKEEDHSLFRLRGENCVIAINISFEQRRKASWPYMLKSSIFNFFDVFPRRRRWPEEEKYILYFLVSSFYYLKYFFKQYVHGMLVGCLSDTQTLNSKVCKGTSAQADRLMNSGNFGIPLELILAVLATCKMLL